MEKNRKTLGETLNEKQKLLSITYLEWVSPQGRQTLHIAGVPTGFYDFDSILSGLPRGGLTLLSGFSGVGVRYVMCHQGQSSGQEQQKWQK
jgi:replicative DNA helicase